MSPATYRALLRAPGAAAFFLTAAAGRVGIAMTSLGMVWLVHARTGSYATAGLVTGGFAVAEAVAGPQLARLIDRFGQSRVLPPALLAHAAAVAAMATGTTAVLAVAGLRVRLVHRRPDLDPARLRRPRRLSFPRSRGQFRAKRGEQATIPHHAQKRMIYLSTHLVHQRETPARDGRGNPRG